MSAGASGSTRPRTLFTRPQPERDRAAFMSGMRTPSTLTLDVASFQFVGGREDQQDSIHAQPLGQLWNVWVADGVAGNPRGGDASRAAMHAAAAFIEQNSQANNAFDASVLRAAVLQAHAAVCELEPEPRSDTPPCSTLSGGLIDPERRRSCLVSVGDSSILHLRDGQFSLVGGRHEPGQPWHALGLNLGEQHCGIHVVNPERDLRAGDWLLIASDGLFALNEAQWLDALSATTARQAACALQIALEAMNMPDSDNSSVVVVRIGQNPDEYTEAAS